MEDFRFFFFIFFLYRRQNVVVTPLTIDRCNIRAYTATDIIYCANTKVFYIKIIFFFFFIPLLFIKFAVVNRHAVAVNILFISSRVRRRAARSFAKWNAMRLRARAYDSDVCTLSRWAKRISIASSTPPSWLSVRFYDTYIISIILISNNCKNTPVY